MTPISSTTFIHICSSQVTYRKIATTNNHIRKQVNLKGSTITAKHTPTLPFLTVFSSAKKIVLQSALVLQLDMEITAKLHGSIRICTGIQHWISVSWIVIDVKDFGWMNVIQMIHYFLNFNALHMILTTNTRLNIISLTVWPIPSLEGNLLISCHAYLATTICISLVLHAYYLNLLGGTGMLIAEW